MHGHLVIADISGYTRFLTDSELDHANGIIGELLNAVIGAIQAPLTVSSVEGDAVFMYGTMPDDIDGQTVLESVEMLYCSFAGALETMTLNTTCRCNACVNIANLGLKIVMHCGEYMVTDIGGRQTITGPDVILAHRLLKNHIRERTGIADYMLVTQACVDDLDIHRMVGGWMPHTEEYEIVGTVSGYVSSLPDIWAYIRSQKVDKVLQGDAWGTVTVFSQAPPAVVWDTLMNPHKRNQWTQAHEHTVTDDVAGRIGTGSTYHCAHGDNQLSLFTVTDMRPLEYVTFALAMDEHVGMKYTDYLIPSGTGTRITTHAGAPYALATGETLPPAALDEMQPMLMGGYQESLERLSAIAEETASRLAGV